MSSNLIALAVLLTASIQAATPPAKPTLQEIIFNSKYLNESLGTHVLLVTEEKTGAVSDELQRAIIKAKLDEGRQFHPLPKDSTPPVAKSRSEPSYPSDLRRAHVSGSARLIFLIGSDGGVKGVYVYESAYREFAVAAAAAIIKWKFTPAMIGKTPVPVLAVQLMEFNSD